MFQRYINFIIVIIIVTVTNIAIIRRLYFGTFIFGYKKIVFCSQKPLIWYVYSFKKVLLKFCENTFRKVSVRMD